MNWLARVFGRGTGSGVQPGESHDGESLYSQGLAAEAAGRGDKAAALLQRAVAAQPSNAEFHCALGTVQFRSGRTRAAAETFRAGLELDAGDRTAPDLLQGAALE